LVLRTLSSIDIAAFKLTDKVLIELNNKVMVGGIFCNLQKAVDCVNHDILLTNLQLYGITETAHK